MTAQGPANDVGAFLAVFAALLLDNVVRFEETVGRVTDLVIGSGRPDRELVVALQGFDRLKQEFEALGDALTRYAQSTNEVPQAGEERAQLGQQVIAAITIAELKDQLMRRLRDNLPEVAAPQVLDLAAEVGVDVVF
ncbi:MAG TPA: hypothetical protein VMF32_26995 [Xanthobacteraceae bacterium]|nr:hypothetical protein [Xanthobacteraceae bacterium]